MNGGPGSPSLISVNMLEEISIVRQVAYRRQQSRNLTRLNPHIHRQPPRVSATYVAVHSLVGSKR